MVHPPGESVTALLPATRNLGSADQSHHLNGGIVSRRNIVVVRVAGARLDDAPLLQDGYEEQSDQGKDACPVNPAGPPSGKDSPA